MQFTGISHKLPFKPSVMQAQNEAYITGIDEDSNVFRYYRLRQLVWASSEDEARISAINSAVASWQPWQISTVVSIRKASNHRFYVTIDMREWK